MTPSVPAEPPEHAAGPDHIQLESNDQLRAIASHTRHRVLAVLRDGPATITQIAASLHIAKGSSNYHVKVLERAGLIHVAQTRKVGGVTERYYAMVKGGIELPEPKQGEPDLLVRHALADMEAAPAGGQKTVWLKHTRLSPEAWDEFARRAEALLTELGEARDPTQPAATMLLSFFRPIDHLAPSAPSAADVPESDEI